MKIRYNWWNLVITPLKLWIMGIPHLIPCGVIIIWCCGVISFWCRIVTGCYRWLRRLFSSCSWMTLFWIDSSFLVIISSNSTNKGLTSFNVVWLLISSNSWLISDILVCSIIHKYFINQKKSLYCDFPCYLLGFNHRSFIFYFDLIRSKCTFWSVISPNNCLVYVVINLFPFFSYFFYYFTHRTKVINYSTTSKTFWFNS